MKPSIVAGASNPLRNWRKVTYCLPAGLARELDARTAGRGKIKSRVVSEALAHYFEAQDRQSLAVLYEQAAQDPRFVADNRAVEEDFAALEGEVDRGAP